MSSLLCTAPRKTPRTRPQCPASHTRWPAFLFWRLFLRLALFDVSGVLEAPEMCPRCLRCFVFRSVWHWSALSWVSTCGSGVFRVVVASPSLPLRSSSDVGQVLVVGLVVWRACSCLRCLFVFFCIFVVRVMCWVLRSIGNSILAITALWSGCAAAASVQQSSGLCVPSPLMYLGSVSLWSRSS